MRRDRQNLWQRIQASSILRGSSPRRSTSRYPALLAGALSAGVLAGMLAGCTSEDVAEPPAAPATAEGDPAAAAQAEAAADLATSEPSPPAATLTIGDPAPPLSVDQWIAGTPVEPNLKDGIHVVEFWATWCGPCLAGMPHLSELQQHYGDQVKFVGVTREDAETVEGFLEKESPHGKTWSEVIQYRLAIDAGDATNMAYMKAANQNGIPTAFVVGREGHIEWIGHPMRIDQPLEQIVEGSWDREAALAEFQQQERLKQLNRQLQQWAAAQEWDQAIAALDTLEEETGRSPSTLRFRVMILERSGQGDQADALRSELVDLVFDNPSMLNEIAWRIASSGRTDQLPLAKRAAERASELSEHRDPSILDTLARVHYELGDLDQAIHWQQLAVEHNTGMEQIEQTLDKYLAEQREAAPPETPAAGKSETEESDAESGEPEPGASESPGAEPGSPGADEAEPDEEVEEVDSAAEPEADTPPPDQGEQRNP